MDNFIFFVSAYIAVVVVLFGYIWKLQCNLKNLEKEIELLKKK
jgi:CcmD family protein